MIEGIEREPSTHRWIVEGAGGVLVPINERETIADLMAQLQLPVVVVVRTKLGTINHTLLTLETASPPHASSSGGRHGRRTQRGQ